MKIIIQNVVRDPSTLEIRRRHPGSITPAPLIGGHRLPPRRSRTVETSLLDDRDFLTLAEMTQCGVLRVFSASPFTQLSSEAIRAWIKSPAQVEAPITVIETPLIVVETEVAVEVVTTVETEVQTPEAAPEAADEPGAETQVSQPSRDDLLELKNAELRAKLSDLGGGNGTGLSKSQLVDAILERLA